MTNKPTVAEFFAQYAEKGVIFPDGGLRVKCRDGAERRMMFIPPNYYHWEQRVFNDCGAANWYMDGTYKVVRQYKLKKPKTHESDIIAVLNDAGNVIAEEV